MPSDIPREAFTQDLLESDARYFELAAGIETLGLGDLVYMPGLERLAAGCVIQRVRTEDGTSDLEEWVRTVQRRIGECDGACPRFYLQTPFSQLEDALRRCGYKCKNEIALLNFSPAEHDENDVYLHLVDGDADWAAKRTLHAAAGTGPDGHENAPGLWVDLEHRKSDAGGLELFLVMHGNDVIGALGLMEAGSILRLKNLVIHPDYRGSGFGAKAVQAGCVAAARRGFAVVGAFALDEQGTLAFYDSCGFRPVAAQTEWTLGG